MSNAKTLYRISSGLLFLFAAGHTQGFLAQTGKPPEALPVLEIMQSVHFETMGFVRSYWDFYVGFGLFTTAYFVLAAIWCWQLADLCGPHPAVVLKLVRPLILCQLAMSLLACTNFFWGPIVFSTLITLCLIIATLFLRRDQASS